MLGGFYLTLFTLQVPFYGQLCHTDKDCEIGFSDQHSHGVQTGACVKFDVTRKTCEVYAWCPIETKAKPQRPALLESAENFTVLIKNDIRFPAFNFIRRNILPWMDATYLKGCQFSRVKDPLCPIFRLGDIIKEARENFSQMAIEGGVIGIQINWDCNLDGIFHNCLPKYTFRRLDEKESNRTLYPGLNFRFARYNAQNGIEERTLYKAFGIRFDVMVFGKAGKFSIIQLIIYIGSTISYYALSTIIIDWLIGTSCYSKEARQDFSEKKVESVRDRQQCILCVSFVDEDHIRVVKKSQKKSLQVVKPITIHRCRDEEVHLRVMVGIMQPGSTIAKQPQPILPRPGCPAWCYCGCCGSPSLPQEQLCCRQSKGRCITTCPPFEQLVLTKTLLEAVLLYREPLWEWAQEDKTTTLRHCAYRQYISWRFGIPPKETRPVIPSCCVLRIREEYPSPDGQYSGLQPTKTITLRSGPFTKC